MCSLGQMRGQSDGNGGYFGDLSVLGSLCELKQLESLK